MQKKSEQHYIYKTYDPITGEYYIGSRTPDTCSLAKNDTGYSGSFSAWKPKNQSRLQKEILGIYPTRPLANSFERKLLIEKLKVDKDEKCMNAHIPSIGFCNYGNKYSLEVRNKISKAISGENNPMYGMTGSLNPFYGRNHTEETKKKIGNTHKGRNNYWFNSNRTGSLNPFYNRTHTNKSKEKMSIARKKWHKNNDNPMLGINHTEEAKQKIREAKMKKVKHLKSGNVFNSITECADFYKISTKCVSSHCNGYTKSKKYKFVET